MFSRLSLVTSLIIALLVAVPASSSASGKNSSDAFNKLLNEAGLKFNQPDNFKEIGIHRNELFNYEHAMTHNSLPLEARFAIRPIQRITIDYQDPHNAAPEPNHLFPLLFSSIVESLSRDGYSPRKEYPSEEAQKKFNADWAAAAVFDIRPEFSNKYKQGLLIAMHKSGKSDAYVIYLFNDYEKTKAAIDASMSTLVFN